MTFEKYQQYCSEVKKIMESPDVALAIKTQDELSSEVNKKDEERLKIQDKLLELYHSIDTTKVSDSFRGFNRLPEYERLAQLSKMWVADDPQLNVIREAMEKSGKQEEIAKLENDLEKATFDYFEALLKLDSKINESREKLFTDKYKRKLNEFADKGVLLYFFETPDVPLLSENVSIDDVLESFGFGGCVSLKGLFRGIVNLENPSRSMNRKIDDIVASIACIEEGFYRSAARTLFALLESEHKNCSSAMDNFFTLNNSFRKGKKRAEKIYEILTHLEKESYFSKVWEVVNRHYKTILDSKTDSFIDRNSIIHGDYDSEKLDVTEKDVIKLMLLFINMRMISDHIQLYCEMLRKCISYAQIHFAQEQKKKTKKVNKS